jgi:hypothetical protein
MNAEFLYMLAGKAAFYDLDYCPGTGFYEVLDDDAIGDIVSCAQRLIDKIEVSIPPINQYHVAVALWGMDSETFDAELADWNSDTTS